MADPDRRTALLESYENAAVIVSGITVEKVTQRTPCAGYDVAGLIDHMVEAAHRAAALGRGRTPPAGDEAPHVELADAPDQLRLAAEEAAQSWGDDSQLSSSFAMPWGERYSGATLVNMYLAELATHAWDLAKATGQLERLDPFLATSALDGARAMLKPEYRDRVSTGSPFGAEFPPPLDADDWELLAAFMGRDPRASLERWPSE
ncbi:MAG: TIGR03086 family protein [Acidimicrobiaceae bacterium]|nr:TIGR03086 family protein [Acidimicrobiaceae bacterium]